MPLAQILYDKGPLDKISGIVWTVIGFASRAVPFYALNFGVHTSTSGGGAGPSAVRSSCKLRLRRADLQGKVCASQRLTSTGGTNKCKGRVRDPPLQSAWIANRKSQNRQSSMKIIRRRPTLPHSSPCSTMGPGGVNFRVRDGNGF